MIAYHIDRYNSLHIGQDINLFTYTSNMSSRLFNNKVSKHGANYLDKCYAPDLCSFLIEYEYELIRQRFFPNCISRYQSFFALKNIEDIVCWSNFLSPDFKVYEIEFFHDNYQLFDTSHLKGGPDLNNNLLWAPEPTFDSAFHYWSGEYSQSPQPELLILPPLTIKAEKHLSIDLI